MSGSPHKAHGGVFYHRTGLLKLETFRKSVSGPKAKASLKASLDAGIIVRSLASRRLCPEDGKNGACLLRGMHPTPVSLNQAKSTLPGLRACHITGSEADQKPTSWRRSLRFYTGDTL